MISLDQVQMLEKKVEVVVSKIAQLQHANDVLTAQNRELQEKNSLLVQKISSFEVDQNRIEQGILSALNRLDSMENAVLQTGSTMQQPSQPIVESSIKEETIQQPTEPEQQNEEISLGLDFDLDKTDDSSDNQDTIPDIF